MCLPAERADNASDALSDARHMSMPLLQPGEGDTAQAVATADAVGAAAVGATAGGRGLLRLPLDVSALEPLGLLPPSGSLPPTPEEGAHAAVVDLYSRSARVAGGGDISTVFIIVDLCGLGGGPAITKEDPSGSGGMDIDGVSLHDTAPGLTLESYVSNCSVGAARINRSNSRAADAGVGYAWVSGSYARSLLSYLHELGHNLWLGHAGVGSCDDCDWSCAMGMCCRARCFNGPHAWQLGWAVPPPSHVMSAATLPLGVRRRLALPAALTSQSSLAVAFGGGVTVHSYNGTSQRDTASTRLLARLLEGNSWWDVAPAAAPPPPPSPASGQHRYTRGLGRRHIVLEAGKEQAAPALRAVS
eukprot:XP_001697104.1 predicted protein [Chlamydomonas reinhardtii]